ncbi:hypothetical protein JOF28_000910 [Leucobacter exalbidus]|uniref:Uncharacterized protein n=1 Tax=Leucobacter exalbidus TaxID=662960 RepID=A0A940PRY3_9MICO|nr:hypothetical protein [Leucobacter exalbidus]MBP1325678.1 hypothetical protein [Leucobacter exalbidus]
MAMVDIESNENLPGQKRNFGPIIHRIFATVMVFVVAVMCLWAGFALLFVGASVLWDRNDLTTLEQWTSAIGFTAQSATGVVIAAAMMLAVIAIITVIAAWNHQRSWFVAGVLSGGMLVATLALVSTNALGSLNEVIRETNERIGSVTLEVPGSPATGSTVPEEIVPLSQTDAEAEVVRMAEIAASFSKGPIVVVDDVTGEEATFAATELPLRVESCRPTPSGQTGEQVSARFALPSDAEGQTVSQIVAAWSEAGYPVHDQMKSQYFMGSEILPVRSASVNDSYTINGNLWVDIVSGCASTADSAAN